MRASGVAPPTATRWPPAATSSRPPPDAGGEVDPRGQGHRRLRLPRRRRARGRGAAGAQAPRRRWPDGAGPRRDGSSDGGAGAVDEPRLATAAPCGWPCRSTGRSRLPRPRRDAALPPLHHLLLADIGEALVMTSGNLPEEPIAYRDDDARERLGRSPTRSWPTTGHSGSQRRLRAALAAPELRRAPLVLRRSRGLAPAGVRLPVAGLRGRCSAAVPSSRALLPRAGRARAWVGHHIGDLRNWETLSSFREGVEHFQRLFGTEPELVAHDLHPDYLSTAYAQEREGVAPSPCSITTPAWPPAWPSTASPGTAVGGDFRRQRLRARATVGGEFLVGGLAAYQRAGFLLPVRLPGGDAAAQEPGGWRAPGWSRRWTPSARSCRRLAGEVDQRSWGGVCELVAGGQLAAHHERRAPLRRRRRALWHPPVATRARRPPSWRVRRRSPRRPLPDRGDDPGPRSRDRRPARDLLALLGDLEADAPLATMGARFHAALAHATAEACAR